ncbi:MAG: hypothetical protein WBB45_20860 [Cyclobacteriaceae bacterium]
MLSNVDIIFGLIFGLIIFVLIGAFYGIKSTDTGGSRLLLLSLAANLMSFTVFGVVFTIIWVVGLIAGYDLSIPHFYLALPMMIIAGVAGFFVGYLIGKVVKPDHRVVH